MAYVKDNNYAFMPFSSETPPKTDFYIYHNVDDLIMKSEHNKEELFKCRTVGVLESANGRFFLKDVDGLAEAPKLQVSLAYIKAPIKSTSSPLPVQILGSVQWKKRPVLYATIVQDLTPAMAIRLKKTMSGVTSVHLARDIQLDVSMESEPMRLPQNSPDIFE